MGFRPGLDPQRGHSLDAGGEVGGAGGGQRCGNSIRISDPENHRALGLAGQGVCHLGPIREGCLGEEASEQDRERSRVWMGEWEEVQASQAAGMA